MIISGYEYIERCKAKAAGKVYVKPKKKKKKIQLPEVKQDDSSDVVAQEELPVDIGRLDLRVGKTIWAQKHPLKPQYYMQYVDLNNRHLTMIVSELVNHYNLQDFENERDTVVLCNVRHPTIYGITSQGLVLCAVKDGKAEMLTAPAGSLANDKIYVSGFPRRPDQPHMKPHKMIYETVAEDLRVNDQKQVVYKGIPLQVEGREGYITTKQLADCPVRCI